MQPSNRIRQLRAFCQAAQTASISRAAERLHLSQPTVSQLVKSLEEDLGIGLFERRGPRIALTPAGQTLLDTALPLVEGIDQLPDRFHAQLGTLRGGRLDIAAGESTILYLLPDAVKRFADAHPQTELHLHNVTGRDGLELLRAGEVDFAADRVDATFTDPEIETHLGFLEGRHVGAQEVVAVPGRAAHVGLQHRVAVGGQHLSVGVRDILGKEDVRNTHRALSDVAEIVVSAELIDPERRVSLPALDGVGPDDLRIRELASRIDPSFDDASAPSLDEVDPSGASGTNGRASSTTASSASEAETETPDSSSADDRTTDNNTVGDNTAGDNTAEVDEVILAVNPNVEGDTTAYYISQLLEPFDVTVTRIARGLPIGGDLEYADEATLSRALEGRGNV